MPTTFPFVEIPPANAKYFGGRDPETRVYRREGSDEEVGAWYDKIVEVAGPSVSPGGVCMYARVSRAAVYKAINQGRLTAFGFHVISKSRGVFGFKGKTREVPYIYIPISEAKSWGEMLKAKASASEPGKRKK